MSDGVHMSDGSEAPELWAPEWGDALNMGERFMLVMFERWADGRGAVRGSIEEFAMRMRIGVSTARSYLSTLVREGFVSRPARGRLDDGTLTPYCHWLNLEKLGNPNLHRQNSAVDETPSEPVSGAVGKAGDPPPELSSDHRQNSASSAETQQPPPELSGGESDGVITTGARVGARAGAAFPFPSYSYFLSFPWRDDDTKDKAEKILSACGEGLGQLGAQGDRVLHSLAYVLAELWVGFDVELDVLPVVRRKTGPGRKSPLWDFALLTENLDAHRARRLRDAERGERKATQPKAAGGYTPPATRKRAQRVADETPQAPVNDDVKRLKRMAALRGFLGMIGEGQRPDWLLTRDEKSFSGAMREEAFGAHARAFMAELEQLEAMVRTDGAVVSEGADGQ